jgi:polyferredoxin
MSIAAIPPRIAAALADAILVLHVGIVAFVVFGLVAIALGGVLGWAWVRGLRWRGVHVALMAFVALQAWVGAVCPLTVWEQALRRHAGQAAYDGSFIEHWLARLIFFDAPAWVFVAAYTAFAMLVLLAWRGVPPRPRRSGRQGPGTS